MFWIQGCVSDNCKSLSDDYLFSMITRWIVIHPAVVQRVRLCTFTAVSIVLIPFFFLLQIYTRYGKCYTFNSGLDGNPLLTTLKGGTGNGLEIMLDIQQDEYLPVWGETGQRSLSIWPLFRCNLIGHSPSMVFVLLFLLRSLIIKVLFQKLHQLLLLPSIGALISTREEWHQITCCLFYLPVPLQLATATAGSISS